MSSETFEETTRGGRNRSIKAYVVTDDDDDDDELFRCGFSKAKYGTKINDTEFRQSIMNGKYRTDERAYGNGLSGYGITIVSNETLRSKR